MSLAPGGPDAIISGDVFTFRASILSVLKLTTMTLVLGVKESIELGGLIKIKVCISFKENF